MIPMINGKPKVKTQAIFFTFYFLLERPTQMHGEGYFGSLGNQARTQSFKNPLFRVPELNIYMLVSLHFSRMAVEYRLGAVSIRHVQECNRNQRPQHTYYVQKSCQGKVKFFHRSSSATAPLNMETSKPVCVISNTALFLHGSRWQNQLLMKSSKNPIYLNLPA